MEANILLIYGRIPCLVQPPLLTGSGQQVCGGGVGRVLVVLVVVSGVENYFSVQLKLKPS